MNIDVIIINKMVVKQIQQYFKRTKFVLPRECKDGLIFENQLICHVYLLRGKLIRLSSYMQKEMFDRIQHPSFIIKEKRKFSKARRNVY